MKSLLTLFSFSLMLKGGYEKGMAKVSVRIKKKFRR
jgi:hypothetical protein